MVRDFYDSAILHTPKPAVSPPPTHGGKHSSHQLMDVRPYVPGAGGSWERSMPMDVYMFGFSESKLIMPALAQLLGCRCCSDQYCCADNSECITDSRWKSNRSTWFLASCSEALSYERATTCNGGGQIQFAWRSFASPLPRTLATQLQQGAAHRRQVVVYSLGPHYFAQFQNHTVAHNERDLLLPQEWWDVWYADMTRLMVQL